MGIKSIWFSNELDEDKLKEIARKQNNSVSKLINNLIKENYNVLKEKKK